MPVQYLSPTKRRPMTKKRAAKIFLREQGRCYLCQKQMRAGVDEFQIEHPDSLILGGSDNDEDLRVICTPCHKAKTAADAGARSKRDEIITKNWQREPGKAPGRGSLTGKRIKYSAARGVHYDRFTGEAVEIEKGTK